VPQRVKPTSRASWIRGDGLSTKVDWNDREGKEEKEKAGRGTVNLRSGALTMAQPRWHNALWHNEEWGRPSPRRVDADSSPLAGMTNLSSSMTNLSSSPADKETRRNFSVGWSSGGGLDTHQELIGFEIAAPPLIARSAHFARRPQLGTSLGTSTFVVLPISTAMRS
jgi:hypothetical protein